MKRIIIFKGGLGNQIFQYGMYTYQRYVKRRDVGYMYRESDHNGFELDKYFDVELKKVGAFYKLLYWLVWRLNKYGILKRFIFFERGGRPEANDDIFVNGYWGNKQYFMHPYMKLDYKPLPLSERNQRVADLLTSTQSVAIHVRRGDYLLPQNKALFNTLGVDYYRQAIQTCQDRLGTNVRFFFFSDDIEWVKANLPVEQAEYIDWNKGNDSICDMRLMSMASAVVIANSTFSFWAAMLSKRAQLVIGPVHWYADGSPRDIFPDDWLKL